MNEWFSKAKNIFKREVPTGPQPFVIACECGKSHTGIRRSRHQHIVCKSCGMSVFVLPRDVYPQPAPSSKKKKNRKKAKGRRSKPAVEILDDVEVIGPDDGVPRKSRSKSKKKDRSPKPEPGPGLFSRAGQSISNTTGNWISAILGLFTPLRLIVLAIVAVGVFMASLAFRDSQRSAARETILVKVEEGYAALEERDWIEARDAFSLAVNAFDILDRNDDEANAVRQWHRETSALTHLSGKSLFEIFEWADEVETDSGLDQWNTEFTGERSRWVVMTAPVIAIPPSEEGMSITHEVVFPWSTSHGRKTHINVNFPIMSQLVSPSGSTTITFAGQLEACEYSDGDNSWRLHLNPETGFAWANQETFDSLGFLPVDHEAGEEQALRLLHQSEVIGLKQELTALDKAIQDEAEVEDQL